ncbi:hypothetical protein ACXIZN_09790 [Amycolatopsis sp. TRM77291]
MIETTSATDENTKPCIGSDENLAGTVGPAAAATEEPTRRCGRRLVEQLAARAEAGASSA